MIVEGDALEKMLLVAKKKMEKKRVFFLSYSILRGRENLQCSMSVISKGVGQEETPRIVKTKSAVKEEVV